MCDYCEHSKIFGRRRIYVDGVGKAVTFGSINMSKDGSNRYLRVQRVPSKDESKRDDVFTMSLKYCPFCGEKLVSDPIIPEITNKSAIEMLNHKANAPKMKFWLKEEARYLGIDNTTGNFKMKDFSSKEECLAWLAGEGKNTAAKNSPCVMG